MIHWSDCSTKQRADVEQTLFDMLHKASKMPHDAPGRKKRIKDAAIAINHYNRLLNKLYPQPRKKHRG